MVAQNGIILVTQEPGTARAVSSALQPARADAAPVVCGDLGQLVRSLQSEPARAALVDIDPDPESMLHELDAIIGRFEGTRFIVLAQEQRQAWLLRAMEAGARHFVAKPEIEGLHEVIARVAPPGGDRGADGAVVTVLSAGGGCGATTLAVNLANELQLASEAPTLMVDLDAAYGGMAGALGLTASYGVADVLDAGDRLDAQLVRSSTVEHDARLSLLASPATVDPEAPRPLAFDALDALLVRGRESYAYVVVDAPRVPIAAAETLARAAVQVFLVLEMNVEDLRVARLTMNGLLARGVAPERVLPLVSRYRPRRDPISLAEAGRTLRAPRIAWLPSDYKHVVASINYGTLLADAAPRSEIRRRIRALASAVHERVPCGATT